MLIIDEVKQGSEDWLKLRLGKITASNFAKIITPSGSKSSQANQYVGQLVEETLTGKLTENITTEDMERGIELEPEARKFYEDIKEIDVNTDAGICFLNENKKIGCSPDGLIYQDDKLVKGLEIKCPKLSTHIAYLIGNKLPSKYKPQVQGSMWVTGLSEWDFLSYSSEKDPLIITVKRDDDFIEKLEKYAWECLDLIDKFTKKEVAF